MILLISHFTIIKGTTDFFADFLENRNIPYYYLRHPFNGEQSKYSELIYFDGKKKSTVKKFKKCDNLLLDLAKNFIITSWVMISLKPRADKVFGFGGFNVIPGIILKKNLGCKIYFWGIDYSRKRFENLFLNKIYLFFETLSCKYCTAVISQSSRQADARMKFHHLDKARSFVSSNGIEKIDFHKDFSAYKDVGLIYIGSLTKHHGVVNFVKIFYVNKNFNIPLFVIGAGEEEKTLMSLIKTSHLSDRVFYFGYQKNQDEIINILQSLDKRLFGIAPYDDQFNDDVYYRDSLKIKEYLNYNIPFIISDKMYISKSLKEFGILYDDINEFPKKIESKIKSFILNIGRKKTALSRYYWETIFNEVLNMAK